VNLPDANRVAAISLSAEFLAPETLTVPDSGPDCRTRMKVGPSTGEALFTT